MANFPTGKSYNYAWQNSKFAGITYSGSGVSQFTNDAGYITSSASSSFATTASYALQALSSSYALTTSFALNGGGSVDTSSFVTTSSFNQFTSSYYLDSASFSSSIASLTTATSSYILVSQTSSMTVLSASYANTASFVQTAQTASYVLQAVSASYATSASQTENAQTASYVLQAVSSSFASTASYVLEAVSSSFASTASYVLQAVSSSFSTTSSYSLDSDLLDGKDSTTFTTTGSNLFIGTQEISGALQLNPTIDPGSSNTTSSFFFVTSSGDNTEFNLHYRNNGALWETHWLEERTDTGLVWGGILTFTGTTMSITPGAGLIVNHNTNTGSHGDTVATYIQFGPITASATFITSSQVTYLLIDTDGSLIQQTSPFTPQQFNEKLPLGYIFCLTTSSISSYADARTTTYGLDEQQSQFIRAFGPLKVSGYDITPQSGSLKISIASGRAYRFGGFYTQDPDNPSIYDSSAVATGSLLRVYRDPAAVGGFKATLSSSGFPFTDIDPTMWDDGSVTLQAVGASEWTIQRVFQGVINNISYIYYGQNTYDSLNAAVQSITTEAFEESQTSIIALPFIGYIIARVNTTDLGDTANNKIINSGLFRNTAGSSGGGGVATTNLNDLADVNITSPSTGQALVYNAGLWENNTPLNSTSASYADTASYVELAQTASYITTAQTASYVLQAVSSSFASTASYVELAQSASYVLNAISSSYSDTASYTPNAIITASVNLDTITFTKGNGSTFPITVVITGSNTTASFTNQSTWTFNHNLGTQLVIIQAFNTNYEQIIPRNITLNGVNQATITFPNNQSGYAVASLGGNSISELNKVFVQRLQITGINAADNTTYYGSVLTVATTNATIHKYTLPYALTLVGAHITSYNITGNATSELSSVFVRVNNTTDISLSSNISFGGTAPVLNAYPITGISQSLAANDDIQLKWTTPTWVTNPNSCGIFVDLYFYKT